MVSLENRETGFYATDESVVHSSEFSALPLGPDPGFGAGVYIVDVIMPIALMQPKNVQSVIGTKGEYLSGTLVKKNTVGKTVEYSFPYSVGTPIEIQAAQSAHQKLVAHVRAEIERLLKSGLSMEQYRHTDNLLSLRMCGEAMHRNQTAADKARAGAKLLSRKYSDLYIAATEVWACNSCSDHALESCKRVQKSLDDQRRLTTQWEK